jgi:hypothetical protein
MPIKLNKTLKILKQALVAKQNFIKTLIKIFGCYMWLVALAEGLPPPQDPIPAGTAPPQCPPPSTLTSPSSLLVARLPTRPLGHRWLLGRSSLPFDSNKSLPPPP